MFKTDYALVDGTHLAFRNFYAVKNLSRKDGFPTNALYGFVGSLWNLENKVQINHKIIFFDRGRSKKRLEILSEYKANRPPAPENFKIQLPWIKRLSQLLGYTLIEKEGVEADDLIGAWAERISREGKNGLIISADKDLMQCINKNIQQLVPENSEWSQLGIKEVEKKFGVHPNQMVDFLALTGDNIDHFRGVDGVGPKTAAGWLKTYGSIEILLHNLSNLKPERFRALLETSKNLLLRNQMLVKLETANLISEVDWISAQKMHETIEELIQALQELELHSLVKRAYERYSPTKAPAMKNPTAQTEFNF